MPKKSIPDNIKIALLNVHFSANLGDGLLSECLAFGLTQSDSSIDTFPVDLAGRTTISTLGGSKRGLALTALSIMPKPLRQLALNVIQTHFLKTLWRHHYETLLRDANCIVLGGGNLIVDQDLNFPVKIHAALKTAKQYGLPVHIYGVGVGKTFSHKGLELLRSAFATCDLRSVTVRDEASKANWDAHFSECCGQSATTVFDPGVLTSAKWKSPPPPQTFEKPIDCVVGIIAPKELSYHGTPMKTQELADWFLDLLKGLTEKGYQTALFSNGSPADNSFLHEYILPHVPMTPVAIPNNPNELSSIVCHSDLTVAFRLHALIPAASYGKHIVALEWDAKVRSFMKKMGKVEASLDIRQTPASEAANLCDSLLKGSKPSLNLSQKAQTEIELLATTIRKEHE